MIPNWAVVGVQEGGAAFKGNFKLQVWEPAELKQRKMQNPTFGKECACGLTDWIADLPGEELCVKPMQY